VTVVVGFLLLPVVVLVQDCGLPFLYAVCSLGVKANMKKLIGASDPKVSANVPSRFTLPASLTQ
jgi:hypothetical protein